MNKAEAQTIVAAFSLWESIQGGMNSQSRKLDQLANCGAINKYVLDNYREGNIKLFMKGEAFQVINGDGEWVDDLSPGFDQSPEYYHIKPKPRLIDGEKAMKGGAWGMELEFSNNAYDLERWKVSELRGLWVNSSYRFCTDELNYKYARFPEGAEVVTEWLKEDL